MSEMTRAQWQQFIEQWRQAGPAVARAHREELRTRAYDAEAVNDLLEIGDDLWRSRKSSGLVELQRWLLKLADVQSLQPRMVHEDCAQYGD